MTANGLRSLYDVLSFAAGDFQALLSEILQLRWEVNLYVGLRGQPIDKEKADRIVSSLQRVLTHSEALHLRLSTVAIRRVIDANAQTPIEQLSQAITDIEGRIHDELDTELRVHVPNPSYFETPDWIGIDTLLQFPSLQWEATEAATCYALERYTACVFHLMRILEYGLASLASALKVPITNPNWHQILLACEKQISALKDHDPRWKENEQFYNSVALEFRHFQRALRNHTAHARERYDESEAKAVLDHVASLMKQISTRMAEVTMP